MFTSKRPNGTMNSTNQTETSSASSASGGIDRDRLSTSQSIGSRPGTRPLGHSDSTPSLYDPLPNGTTTTTNSSASASTSTKQNFKSVVTGSTLLPPALESSNKQGVELATQVSHQIKADKVEVVNIIANYAVEPSEMLHLVDRWIQQLLSEFKQQEDYFKHRLSEKWQNEELTNLTYENRDQIRRVYTAYRDLERARNVLLSQESFDELNNYIKDIHESETAAMKQRFNELAHDYSNIIRSLESIDKEIGNTNDDTFVKDTRKTLAKLKQLNNKQSHTICIVGLEKAGKSTYTNALLGYQLVPTAAERCTQVRTVLKPPPENDDQSLFAKVTFYDDDEFQFFYGKMVKKTDETDEQLSNRRQTVINARDAIRTKLPEEYFRINNKNDIDRERTAICRELCDYITGEVYVNIIKEISIYTDKLPGKNYELLDVPGFDSPIREHREAGLEAIKNADAFVFLTNGQHPNLTEPQIRLLTEIQQNHFEAMQRAFGIITKLDLCLTPTTYKDHCGKALNELIEKKFKREHIYLACPRLKILDENSDEYRVITSKLNDFSQDLLHGFERSKEALNRFIEYELPKTHLKQLIELGRMRLRQSVIERINLIQEKRLLPNDLVNMSVDEYIRQQKIESWDRVYKSNIFQPAFDEANHWHTLVVTKERVKFIDDVRQTFHDAFRERTKQFLNSTEQIERQMYQKYTFVKIQLNPHEVDNNVREQLCFTLEKIVDDTSDVLAKHFYHKYVCGLEMIFNDICPYLKDLYRTNLTLEKCIYETHALILRVCRPMITAILRYSHFDALVKKNAITELIYIAPTVAYNIACTARQDGYGDITATNINESVESLAENDEMTTLIIRTLFNKNK